MSWLLLPEEDVPAVLPAQGPQLPGRQRGPPVGHRAEGAVGKVNRGEPGYGQPTEHALEKHRPRGRGGKAQGLEQGWPGTSEGRCQPCRAVTSAQLLLPAEVVAEVLQDNGNQENLEGEGRQVVVEEKCLLHQEEGQVVHSPAPNRDAPSCKPELPGICRRQETAEGMSPAHPKALAGWLLAGLGGYFPHSAFCANSTFNFPTLS